MGATEILLWIIPVLMAGAGWLLGLRIGLRGLIRRKPTAFSSNCVNVPMYVLFAELMLIAVANVGLEKLSTWQRGVIVAGCLLSVFIVFRHPQTLTCLCARKESVNDSVIRALQEMGIEHTIRQPSLLSRLYGRTVILLPQLSATLILWNSHGRASLSIRPRCPKTLYCAVS